ncbi:MAG: 5-formyltetrahydrofolate cyclo-ligase [Methylomonas sp.]|jgi:5-formyltetrahydrofolate cyclo-ligase|nr:MAG: 5-formyltetrahydrofolate cyclo-ligase [Methylomonas sp.]
MNKAQQRQTAYARRNAQVDKDVISREICRRFIELPAYEQAQTVLWYVHCRSEVRTLPTLLQQLHTDKRMAVPYCTVDAKGNTCLGLWLLKALDELQPGMWNILEPPKSRWGDSDRQIRPAELDIVMVPGVGFDKRGGRLGNGAGYYDRLLSEVRKDAVRVGIGYESQLFPEIITEPHDVLMDKVITERAVYCGQRQ